MNKEFDVSLPVDIHDIKQVLEKHPDLYAIYLTSPSFEGLFCQYKEIREMFPDLVLICDEAHGAHAYFSNDLPTPSLKNGWDI
jgi:arginine/lysine/ornithine decarboxylase